MELSRDLIEVLSALNAHRVEYLIVGGYAYSTHVEVRATKDLDIWIAVGRQNSEAVFQALASFGAPLQGCSPEDFRDGKSFFIVGHPPHRFDILQSIDAVTFEEAWSSRVPAEFGGVPVNVISRDLLIRNKRAVGRLQDLADVQKLESADKFYR